MNHQPLSKHNARTRRCIGLGVPLLTTVLLVATVTTTVADDTPTKSADKEQQQEASSSCSRGLAKCCGGTIVNCDCTRAARTNQVTPDSTCSSSSKIQLDDDEVDAATWLEPHQAVYARDASCPPNQPVRLLHADTCVTCVAYTEDPAEPDWGCSVDRPLCATATTTDAAASAPTTFNRVDPGQAGRVCAPYPCHNTNLGKLTIDDGCTESKPICVDALGNDPLPGGPGMQCVAASAATSATMTLEEQMGEQEIHGNVQARNQRWGRPAFGLLDSSKGPKNSVPNSAVFELVSLCMGCPLSGQGRSCESTKACDSIGGAIINDW